YAPLQEEKPFPRNWAVWVEFNGGSLFEVGGRRRVVGWNGLGGLKKVKLGFESGSLQQFLRQPRPLLHPVSRKVIPNDVLERADKFINFLISKKLMTPSKKKDLAWIPVRRLTREDIRNLSLEVFQEMARQSVVVDERTLLKMSKEQLVAVIQELHSMFMNNFTAAQRRQLRPPKGQPFAFVPRPGNGRVNATNLPLALAQYILRELRQILRRAPQNLKYMVSYVAVGALSSVDGELRASNYYISEMLSRRVTAAVCLILYIVGGVKTEVDDAMLGTGQLVQKSHDAKRGPSKSKLHWFCSLHEAPVECVLIAINIIYVTTGSLLILLVIGFLTKTVILDKPEGEVPSIDETPLVGETPTVGNAEEKDEPEPEVIEIEGSPEDVEVDIEEGQPKEAAGQSRRVSLFSN
ncbi:hypothetical protein FOZ62_017828, partial [Perkinsus olseni]